MTMIDWVAGFLLVILAWWSFSRVRKNYRVRAEEEHLEKRWLRTVHTPSLKKEIL